MTAHPLTIREDASFGDALHLMKEKQIRRLPVRSADGRLIGIVVQKDLFSASPSLATSLSVFEMHHLLVKLKIKDVMTSRVLTVDEDCPLEEAARIMVDHRIGSLPVLKGGELTGIITETDIFKTFVEMLGGRVKGLRLTLDVTEGKGVLASITDHITRQNANIVSLSTFFCRDESERIIMVKVSDALPEPLISDLKTTGLQVLDAHDMTNGGYEPRLVDGKTKPAVRVPD
jgi:acetoin utilization protein AcuB